MILVDMSQIFIACMVMDPDFKKQDYDPGLMRHMTLNKLRSYRVKFHREFGELVLCVEGGKTWRKEIYPYYKAHRQVNKEKDTNFDWTKAYQVFDQLIEEFREYLPYKIVKVPGAEADDVIAVLSRIVDIKEDGMFGEIDVPSIIISSDKDFKQLHRWIGGVGVKQWSPIQNNWVTCSDPDRFLKEQIVCGDRGDGIPNILSDDDVFVVEGKRQKPMREDRLAKLTAPNAIVDMDEETFRRWKRNRQLIDLTLIPTGVQESIKDAFQEAKTNTRGRLLTYLTKHRMKLLTESLNEF